MTEKTPRTLFSARIHVWPGFGLTRSASLPCLQGPGKVDRSSRDRCADVVDPSLNHILNAMPTIMTGQEQATTCPPRGPIGDDCFMLMAASRALKHHPCVRSWTAALLAAPLCMAQLHTSTALIVHATSRTLGNHHCSGVNNCASCFLHVPMQASTTVCLPQPCDTQAK